MLHALKLLLPAVIPSWRFFDVIAPSPRIEYRCTHTPDEPGDAWREFRPRPARVSATVMLARLFWNPHWNETLYLVSCAERIIEDDSDHAQEEIFRRIEADLDKEERLDGSCLQFRLVFLQRTGDELETAVRHVSPVRLRRPRP
ncbi:MAG: hypothetical protein JNM47_13925 [Hyphomonadaceae bacterium]|nr:hypothetical protein [Hyphomonadaceae bacterium]